MIKFIQCIRKKPELSHVEFRRLWAEYRDRAAAVAEVTGVTRFSVSTALTVATNVQLYATPEARGRGSNGNTNELLRQRQ
jgi:hypothetical protein